MQQRERKQQRKSPKYQRQNETADKTEIKKKRANLQFSPPSFTQIQLLLAHSFHCSVLKRKSYRFVLFPSNSFFGSLCMSLFPLFVFFLWRFALFRGCFLSFFPVHSKSERGVSWYWYRRAHECIASHAHIVCFGRRGLDTRVWDMRLRYSSVEATLPTSRMCSVFRLDSGIVINRCENAVKVYLSVEIRSCFINFIRNELFFPGIFIADSQQLRCLISLFRA